MLTIQIVQKEIRPFSYYYYMDQFFLFCFNKNKKWSNGMQYGTLEKDHVIQIISGIV